MTKQELVQNLLSEIERCKIPMPYNKPLRAPDNYWASYPDGDVKDSYGSFESYLACLDVPVLQGLTSIRDYCAKDALCLLRDWEQAGLLVTEPSIIKHNGTPVLKFNHDAYLSYAGTHFHLCEDKSGLKTYGTSSKDIDDLCRVDMALADDYADLKKILYASYALEAIADLRVPVPAIFEEWLEKTFNAIIVNMAERPGHLRMQISYVYQPIRTAYLANNHTVSAVVFFGSNAVSIGCDYKRFGWKNATVVFPTYDPKWEQFGGVLANEETYRDYMWWRLFIFIARYINFYFNFQSVGPIEAGNFDASAVGFFPYQNRCTNIEHLKNAVLGVKR